MSRQESLQVLYGEVCNAYHRITDFRGKLLALVPALSGAGFALIIGRGEGLDERLLLPVGVFGLAVSVGLFVYELRGIFLCHALRDRAAELELAMQRSEEAAEPMLGHFLQRPTSHGLADARKLFEKEGPIMVPTASFLIYGSVIAGWAAVAVFGLVGLF